MPYTQVTFLLSPVDPWRDLLAVELAEIGYDSFEEGWTDPKGGIYELERATGKLQLRAASTTGGYFLHYTCQSE